MAAAGPLRVERDGPLLRITLARPERRNALDAELIAALTSAFADVGDARVVVLAGDGDSFCAGADVEWMRAAAGLSYEENVADSTRLRRMYEASTAARRLFSPPSSDTCSAAASASSAALTR